MRCPALPQLTLSVLLLAGVLGLTAQFLIVGSGPLAIDDWWLATIGGSPDTIAFSTAAVLAEVGSSKGGAVLGAIAAITLLILRRFRDAGALMTALITGVAASETLKTIVTRPRPADMLFDATGHSFPSGHSMGAAALALSIALIVSRGAPVWGRVITWVLAAAWIGGMMWSRALLQVHWLTDTLAGAMLGAAVALAARVLWDRVPLWTAAARGRHSR